MTTSKAHQSVSPNGKIALTNVRVFDEERVGTPRTVVMDGGVIGVDAMGARQVDGKGGVLIPCLIDAHIHITEEDNLHQLTRHGVTTGLDMASTRLRT